MQPLARGPRFGHNKRPLANQFELCVTIWGKHQATARWLQLLDVRKGFAAGKLGRLSGPAQGLAPIAQGLGNVDTGDLVLAVEIGERAADAKRPVIAAGA